MTRARALREAALLAAALLAGCPAKKDCPAGQTDCGGNCVDLQSSATSCGMCGLICASGASCVEGTCGCPPGQIPCPTPGGMGSTCVDPATDAENCGTPSDGPLACGRRCGAGSCIGGACVCDAGAAHCTTDPWPWCVNFATNVSHCGDCATACTRVHESCIPTGGAPPGACGCANPWPNDCGTACVDFQSDPANCDGCGPAFACTLEGTTCTGGSCVCASAAFTECAPNGCFDLQTDERHCGTCPNACTSGNTCCSGSCTNVATDELNCGTCGHACPGTVMCAAGGCCPAATPVECGGSCCAGTTCCGTGGAQCQPAHRNGLGGNYYLGCTLFTASQTTRDAAVAAANSWSAVGATIDGVFSVNCIARQTAGQCAVWCYAGSSAPGKVGQNLVDSNCYSVNPSAGSDWD